MKLSILSRIEMMPEIEYDAYPSRIYLHFQIATYKRMKLIMRTVRYQLKVQTQITKLRVKTKVRTKKSKISLNLIKFPNKINIALQR